MVVRKRRKKNKLRGKRFHGAGNTKNRRGAGSRGGRGRAGSHKHKFTKYYMTFGVKYKLKAKEKPRVVSIGYVSQMLERWLAQGKAKKEGALVIIDGQALGIDKVVGTGSISEKIRLENAKATSGAATKIREAGGTVAGMEEAVADEEFEAEEAEEE